MLICSGNSYNLSHSCLLSTTVLPNPNTVYLVYSFLLSASGCSSFPCGHIPGSHSCSRTPSSTVMCHDDGGKRCIIFERIGWEFRAAETACKPGSRGELAGRWQILVLPQYRWTVASGENLMGTPTGYTGRCGALVVVVVVVVEVVIVCYFTTATAG